MSNSLRLLPLLLVFIYFIPISHGQQSFTPYPTEQVLFEAPLMVASGWNQARQWLAAKATQAFAAPAAGLLLSWVFFPTHNGSLDSFHKGDDALP